MNRRRLALVLAAVALAACDPKSDPTADPPSGYTGPRNSCQQPEDCAEGQRCDSQLRICVSTSILGDRRFVVTIETPVIRASGLPPNMLELEANGRDAAVLVGGADTIMAGPVQVISRVRAAADGVLDLDERNIRAQLFFVSRRERELGLSLHPVPSLSASETGIFRVSLTPGHYSLEVWPLLEDRFCVPVTFIEDIAVDGAGVLSLADTGEPLSNLLLPAAAEPPVSREVRRAGLAMGGLTVEALHSETGRVISTTAVTTCGEVKQPSCGKFSLGLRQGVTSYDLRMRLPSDPAYPTILIEDFSGLKEDAPIELNSLGQPAVLYLQVDGEARLPGGATGFDTIGGCNVVIAGTTQDGGRVELVAHTNESGMLETPAGSLGVLLYPGEYEAFVYPPAPFSDWDPAYAAGRVETFEIEDGVLSYGPVAVTLAPARRLEGEVQASGVPVPSAKVMVEPVDVALPMPGLGFVYTDEQGRFSLRLDPAVYRLTVEPPERSGFAWSTDAVVDLRTADVNPTVNLSVPAVVRLVPPLVSYVGLDDAIVTWYERREDGLRRVGRRIVNSPGEIVGLVPP